MGCPPGPTWLYGSEIEAFADEARVTVPDAVLFIVWLACLLEFDPCYPD